MKQAGIYKIINIINEKIYIGSSVKIEERWRKHKKHLQKNIHHNAHLQKAWNVYGEENFRFDIVEVTSLGRDILENRELYWINFYNSSDEAFGYNLYHFPRKPLNYKYSHEIITERKERYKRDGHPWSGKKHSEETKKKISEANKNKKFSEEHKKNISIARKNTSSSEETKKKISEATAGEKNPRALLKKEDVLKIREMYNSGDRVSKISKIFNVSWSTIDSIVKGKNWRNI